MDFNLKGKRNIMRKVLFLCNRALPTSSWELEKNLFQNGLGAMASALGAGNNSDLETDPLLVFASLLTWDVPRSHIPRGL